MKIKEFSKKLAAFALAFAMIVPTAIPVSAATCPSSVEVKTYKNGYYYTGTHNGAPIEIALDEKGDYIGNLKSSSVNCRVYRVYTSTSNKKAKIGVWSKTPGTYTVTFDVFNSNKVKKESKSIVVKVSYYTYSTSPIKDVLYSGKSIYSGYYDAISIPKSGKLEVKLTKGNKLKGIRIGTREAKTNIYKYKSTKNGKKITLSKVPYKYSYSSSTYSYRRENMEADTMIEITYINKKKEVCTYTTSISKLVNYAK